MFSIFESSEKKAVKSHLRHLVRLALSDGQLHKDELKFIKRIGRENGLAKSEIDPIIENPLSVEIVIPEDPKERFHQIFDLCNLIMKDGHANDAEVDFCADLANRLGFKKVIVGVLVAKIQRGLDEGLTRKEIYKEAKPFINY